MKTILITGASGFIGKHLLKAIKQHPVYSNYIICLLSSVSIPGYKTIVHKNHYINKELFLEQGIFQIDYVIHAGAFIPKSSKDSDAIQQCNGNITSTENLLYSLPNIPSAFIFLSSVDVYSNVGNEAITESTMVDPGSLYGWSKLYGEKLIEKWAYQNNTVCQTLRIGHIYGTGEEAFGKIIPATIRNVKQNISPVIFTKGEELRSFLHVSDCVRLVLKSLEVKNNLGPVNIASENSITIKQLVQTIVNEINSSLPIIIEKKELPSRNLIFDNSKMKQFFGSELVPFMNGIKEEINNFSV